jgi:hypothetical protein
LGGAGIACLASWEYDSPHIPIHHWMCDILELFMALRKMMMIWVLVACRFDLQG